MPVQKILVVEDNEIQREGTALLRRREGYQVATAAEGREALGLVRGGVYPDLVLLDMMIPTPGRDGWWFLEERKRTPALASVPLLVVTALGVASDEWARSLGASGLLRKPVEMEPLLASVRHCLPG